MLLSRASRSSISAPVARSELFSIIDTLRNSTPGPGGVSSQIIRYLSSHHYHVLETIVNYSLGHAWVPPMWRTSKIVLVKKAHSSDLTLDNIRHIALTSVKVKLIE